MAAAGADGIAGRAGGRADGRGSGDAYIGAKAAAPGRRRHCSRAGAGPEARGTGRGERWPAPRTGASVRPRPGVSRREVRSLGDGGGAGVGARGHARVTHLLRRRGPWPRVSVNHWVRRWCRLGPAACVGKGSVQLGGLPGVLISRSVLLTKTPRSESGQKSNSRATRQITDRRETRPARQDPSNPGAPPPPRPPRRSGADITPSVLRGALRSGRKWEVKRRCTVFPAHPAPPRLHFQTGSLRPKGRWGLPTA
ncbi:uncharacterized protein [Bos mutus]|uniref:uncharacterized protein n=1 Tax=Bos mutus TaxID=72004 RepID=UPI0038B5CFF3